MKILLITTICILGFGCTQPLKEKKQVMQDSELPNQKLKTGPLDLNKVKLVKVGDSSKEVLQILGQPQEILTKKQVEQSAYDTGITMALPGDEGWIYRSENLDQISIFFKNGKVDSVIKDKLNR